MSDVETVKVTGIDDLYKLSFNTTRIQGIATGYTLSLTGKGLEGKTFVTCDVGKGKHVIGSKDGVVLQTGSVKSRLYEGESSSIADPLMKALGKVIVMTDVGKTTIRESAGAKPYDDTRIQLMDFPMFIVAFQKLGTGDVQGFIDYTFGKMDIKITVNPSPLTLALAAPGGSPIMQGNVSSTRLYDSFGLRNPMSVGSILRDIVGPLGLELYHDVDNKYILEEPRILQDKPEAIFDIPDEDIVDWSIATDPYNVPDVILPEVELPNIYAMKGMAQTIGLEMLGRNRLTPGTGAFKIQTYTIPPFMLDYEKLAKTAIHTSVVGESPPIFTTTSMNAVMNLYTELAYKSTFYALSSGHVTMVLSPHIKQAYSWYKIQGRMCFVSNINHEISRDGASTTLTIAGVFDPSVKGKLKSSTLFSEGFEKTEAARNGVLAEAADISLKEATEKKKEFDKAPIYNFVESSKVNAEPEDFSSIWSGKAVAAIMDAKV